MTRKSYVQIDGVLVPRELAHLAPLNAGPMIMPDIQPYQSMKTGEEITSRSRHREHLRFHGLIEVGNERLSNSAPAPLDPEKRREAIADAIEQIRGRQ